MDILRISSSNFNGQSPLISYSPLTGGSFNLGVQKIPYDYFSDYLFGEYSMFFSGTGKTYKTNYNPQMVEIKMTSIPSLTYEFSTVGVVKDLNWGDGTPLQNFTSTTISHTYSANTNYTISFTPVELKNINIFSGNNFVNEIKNLPNSLTSATINYGNITDMDFRRLLNLGNLQIFSSNTKSIQLGFINNLTNLNIQKLPLSAITLTNQTKLNQLTLYDTNLSSITLSNNSLLTSINLTGNTNIRNLNVTNSTLLEILNCNNNSLSSLTLSNSCLNGPIDTLLQLNCSNNNLTSLDLSCIQYIYYVDAKGNSLNSTQLDKILLDILTNVNNYSGGSGFLDITDQNPQACPSASGMTNLNDLVVNWGWTINVDPIC